MLNLIQNILDVYKYESAEIKLHKENVDFIKTINSAIGEVEFMAKQKKLIFDMVVKSRITINADATILQRSLVNILSNAVKFATSESKISISGEIIQGNKVRVSIHNIGSYIPPDKQPLIFEKFGQVEKKKQGKISSTGLGLTFCRLAIMGHGGTIGVDSSKTDGTTFWFTLPDAVVGEKITQNEMSEINNLNLIWLSESEKQSLKSLYNQLVELNVFDIIAFKEMFEKIEVQRVKNEKWIKALQDSIYNCVQSDYNKLVAMIIE
jgi:signal transduction histidine kinase